MGFIYNLVKIWGKCRNIYLWELIKWEVVIFDIEDLNGYSWINFLENILFEMYFLVVFCLKVKLCIILMREYF